jgi:hypothetical protein
MRENRKLVTNLSGIENERRRAARGLRALARRLREIILRV